jgi:8-oxo-dGTP pyrophosphatase MutT (NUDIX family)
MLEAIMAQSPTFDFTFPPSASIFTATHQEYVTAHSDARYMRIATGALVFDTVDPITPRILLLQRSAKDSMPNQWEIPGGGCDDEDESILHAVARELREEAGLKAIHISGPVGNTHFFSSRSGKKICKFNFVVQAETNPEGRLMARLDPTEHQQFVWASLAEVRAKKAENIELDFTTPELVATILQAFDQLDPK